MASKGVAELLLRIKTVGEESLDKIKDGLKSVGKAAATAFATISAIVVKSIAEFKEQEAATNALNRAMINSGTYSKATAAEYRKQAEELQKLSVYSGDQITNAQAVIQAQIGSRQVTTELTRAIMDFATAQKMDLASAAEIVGKSIGTSTNALARQGIQLNETASASEKMASVIDQLNAKFGGQAAAAAQGLGSLDQFKNKIDDVFESIGAKLAPIVGAFIQSFTKVSDVFRQTDSFADSIASTFDFLGRLTLKVTTFIQALGDTIGIRLAASVEILKQAANLNLEGMKNAAKLAYDEMGNAIEQRYSTLNAALEQMDNARLAQKQSSIQQEQAMEQEAHANKMARRMEEGIAETNQALEKQIAEDQAIIAQIGASDEQKLQAKIAALDKQLQAETNAKVKQKLLSDKYNLIQQQDEIKRRDHAKKIDEEIARNRQSTLSIIAGMQNESNDTLAAIGKAAALTQIAIETPVAIARALSAFPPPFNFAAAAAVGAAMAAQAARVSGIKLAEGGIVRATPGGVPAIIGEGGKDEAVIPLDKGMSSIGSNVTVNVYGGLLGDAASAREFAVAVDRELLELRRSNQSVAFDERVI